MINHLLSKSLELSNRMDELKQDGLNIKCDLNLFAINVTLASVIGINVSYEQPDRVLVSIFE